MKVVPSDLEIAQAHKMIPITEIAGSIGLGEDDIDLYGKYKAKINLDVLRKFNDKPLGKLIDITAITPTPLGEGKTVTTIGLTQGLGKIGKQVITTLRQPPWDRFSALKGGCRRRLRQVVPMEDINIHFTGDIHAVEAANNLLSAMIDTSILLGNPLNIDPMTVMWNRVLDTNDRALRDIVIGLGGKENGYPRQTSFDMAVASEVMAILALAENLHDLRRRLGRIIVAYTYDGKPVTAEDLKAAGAMTVMMKEALKPNLVQTLEGQACIMHAGPFANIAHGNNSVLADKIALRLADYVVTESGFGSDLGMEKFMNIKCRQSGLRPSCVVITCTIRALKMHGGLGNVVAGKPLPEELTRENLPALAKGCANLAHHIQVASYFGVPVVVSINRFTPDTDAEVALVREKAMEAGALGAYPITVWADGGEGAVELAEAVVAACEKPADFQLLYPDNISIKEKIEILATRVYNADGVVYEPLAERKIKQFEDLGLGHLPICMAKTHLSISHDPSMKGRPGNYIFPIRDIRASVGAGFLYPLAGAMRTMPGLGSKPAAHNVDIDEYGRTVGLF
ncbi:formate--tetrahydrofolate ligase [Desulforamulus profundi]|uniref:Formate--tetrahydrofolate ligase n=1 Tax=Desulforamulus profundi TaxID=1383067 RepID=A0A2C6MEQ4_9FIRM|nr:formate--tetrahydrofolate ligase [Desulforamulus profundi]PHJ38114.1 formate--tetrahydrofolate ligase [Desulforamulus profundi]